MKKLVTVTSKNIIDDLREHADITLVYPLKSFCVGYQIEFEAKEIDDFVLVNRILDDNDLNELEIVLKNNKFKGIVFDDLGIIDLVKDMNIEKILLLDHLATNVRSINYYLDYVDSVIVSNDLTKEEIEFIVRNAKKPLVINVFGLKTLMYSRRLLLTNYQEYYKLPKEKVLETSISDKKFKIIENDYGTKFYAGKYYVAFEVLNLSNVLYFWYDPILLDDEKIKDVVLSNNISDLLVDSLFLNQATFYKVGDADA